MKKMVRIDSKGIRASDILGISSEAPKALEKGKRRASRVQKTENFKSFFFFF